MNANLNPLLFCTKSLGIVQNLYAFPKIPVGYFLQDLFSLTGTKIVISSQKGNYPGSLNDHSKWNVGGGAASVGPKVFFGGAVKEINFA